MAGKTSVFIDNSAPAVDAGWLNIIQTENQNVIETAGQTLSNVTLDQEAIAIASYVAQGGVFCTDSGIADAYVLTQVSPFKAPFALKNGMTFKFRAGNANTGAAAVVACGFASKAIKKQDGSTALSAGDISATRDTEIRYNGSVFVIVNNSPITTVGDIIIGGTGGTPTRLAIGTSTYVLKSNGTTAAWASSAAATSYDSGDQTISTGGTLTLTHSLGAKPDVVRVYIKCTSADLNYSVGDELEFPPMHSDSGSDSIGFEMQVSSTTVTILFGAGGTILSILDKTSRVGSAGNSTKWVMVVRAYKFT